MLATLIPHKTPLRHWVPVCLLAGLLLGHVAPALATREQPPEPLEEIELFIAGGAAGILILPPGAPDRQTPLVLALNDAQGSDGRAAVYTDQLLGAGIAVLEIQVLQGDSLDAVLDALARHPRVAGQAIGLLGFGAGARLAAEWPGPVAARALLYPGCGGLAPAAMRGGSVLLMHGAADPANEPTACASLGRALGAAGARVRLRTFPDATYAWDRPPIGGNTHSAVPRPDGPGRVNSEAWPALAVLSATEVASFFAASLLGRRP